jgi:hypothetical protein
MAIRRLIKANSVLDKLEPSGGLTASAIRYTDGEDDNPDAFVQGQDGSNKSSTVALTVSREELESLAREPELISIVGRITSYVVIKPKTSSMFASMQVDNTNSVTDNIQDVDLVNKKIQDTWSGIQKLLWSNAYNCHNLLSDLYSFGKIYAYVLKDNTNTVTSIEVSVQEPKESKGARGKKEFLTPSGVVIPFENIVTVSYNSIDNHAESYLSYIRAPFRLYKVIERTRVANAIMSAQFRSIYGVPTTKLTKNKARARLSTIYSKWKRDIRLNMTTGDVTINGKTDWPVNSELWTSVTSSGAPTVTNPGDGNPALANMDIVQYFNKKFYKLSKLPISKYEAVDMSYLGDISQSDEDERQFNLFISKNREVLTEFFISIVLTCLKGDQVIPSNCKDIMAMTFHDEVDDNKLDSELEKQTERLDKINAVVAKVREIMDLSVDDLPDITTIDAEMSGLEQDIEMLEIAIILSQTNELAKMALDIAKSSDTASESAKMSKALEDKRGELLAKFMKKSKLGQPLPAMELEEDTWSWDDIDDEGFDDEGFDDEGFDDEGFDDETQDEDDSDIDLSSDDMAELTDDQLTKLKELVTKRLELLTKRRKLVFDKLQRKFSKAMINKFLPDLSSMTTAFSDLSDVNISEYARELAAKDIAKMQKSYKRKMSLQKMKDKSAVQKAAAKLSNKDNIASTSSNIDNPIEE